MPTGHFLHALTIVLCVAAVTTVLFQLLKQPVILGYILAGLIVGPHVPIPLIADAQVVKTLSEVGVILLMFSLGLEFSLRKLWRVGPAAGLTGLIETSFLMMLGFTATQLLGWSTMEGLFAGAVVAISSTTIVARTFSEEGIGGRLRENVVGVLIVEDLIAIVLLASLTAIASGSGLAPGPLAMTVGRLLLFLTILLAGGLLLIPRVIRMVLRLQRPETTVIACVGLCFALALLAEWSGYSVALGAFIAGSLVAESGRARKVEPLIEPVRDIFVAVFFVSVGMLIDPAQVVMNWSIVLLLTVLVVGGKIVGVSCGAFLAGNPLRISLQMGMSLAQIGEFSFIIAGLGLALHATSPLLYSAAIVVSALTTLTTPWLIRIAEPVAIRVDRHLPKSLQTFTVLYGSWIATLTRATRAEGTRLVLRRRFLLLFTDLFLAAAVLVLPVVSTPLILRWGESHLGLSPAVLYPLLIGISLTLATYFILGVIRIGRRIGQSLAELVLPRVAEGRIDLADAPRRLLVVTLELTILMVVGAPLLVLTRPFALPPYLFFLVLGVLVMLGINFWRTATNLEGHVRAGAEVIVDVLARQSQGEGTRDEEGMSQVEAMLPGLGVFGTIRIKPGSIVVDQSLAQLNLRALTGASVLAITREGARIVAPAAKEVLRSGDLLAMTGSKEALKAARQLFETTDG